MAVPSHWPIQSIDGSGSPTACSAAAKTVALARARRVRARCTGVAHRWHRATPPAPRMLRILLGGNSDACARALKARIQRCRATAAKIVVVMQRAPRPDAVRDIWRPLDGIDDDGCRCVLTRCSRASKG